MKFIKESDSPMNSRAFTFSFVVAIIAMAMVYFFIEGKEKEIVGKYGLEKPVVIAKIDIKELDVIDDSKISITTVPANFASPGHFSRIEDLHGTIATVPIKAGEQITAPRITYPGLRTGLSRQISLGKRAMSIRVNEDQAVSKLIKPGDRVDVIATFDYASGRKEMLKVKTVLQDVLVLSTGLNIANSVPLVKFREGKQGRTVKLNEYSSFSTVALELDPYQIQKMIFLERVQARLSLTLRNNDDKEIVRIKSTKLFDVLGDDAGEARSYFEKERRVKR